MAAGVWKTSESMVTEDAIRQRLEVRERSLAPLAAKGISSRGRERAEAPHPFKSTFQEDRDRIIRTKAFRRLKGKTQVFIAPLGDHYLTRLTHTMEVSLIARTVARGLNLNEDLAEAICMGHDLGHSPFGHLGEETLAGLHQGGFRHNRQSVRVVEVLENDGQGLNLTWEVRHGILRHSKSRTGIEGRASPEIDTMEAQVCRIADALAYINHDTDDSIRAGMIAEGDLPAVATAVLGHSHAQRVETLMADIIESSWAATGEIASGAGEAPRIQMSPRVSRAANAVREFLFQRVYEPASATDQARRARDILRLLYGHFVEHPERIPEGYSIRGETPERMALDYVSGMTDSYALGVSEAIQPGIAKGFIEEGVPLALPRVEA